MPEQLGRYIFLAFILLLAVFHSYLWIKIIQKMGYKGWLPILLTAIMSLFLYMSGYYFLVLLIFLSFLAFGKWPILRKAVNKSKKK
ncbi:MAG: hypothetical protein ABIE03_06425 [Patescibacteria group bacterium]|nr:hypothetical protein [Patescibacteria group bacterium]